MAYDQLTLKGATSQLIEIMLRDSTTGQGKTGLAAASVTAYYIREGGSSNTSMTLDGTMTLGTWKTLGWVEVDSTHQKGLYQLGIPNAAIATGANAVTFILTASGTIDKALRLVLLDADLRDATRLGLSALPNATAGATNGLPLSVDSSGRVDVLKLNGTSQTARDIGASVLVSSGTGAGQISLSSGLVTLAGVTHTGARIPNVTPTDTVSTYTGNTVQTGDAYARLGAPAGASHAADVAAVKSDTGGLRTDYTTARAGYLDTLNGLVAAIWANATRTLSAFGFTVATNFDTNVTAIKAKTDNLPASPAAVSDIPTANANADALLKRDWTSVSGEAARSVLNALRFLRNKWSVSSGTLTITKEDDTTAAWTGAVTTDGTAQPITGNDPA